MWFSRLHERSARIIEKLSIRVGSQRFVNEEEDEGDEEWEDLTFSTSLDRNVLKRPEVRKLQRPKQLPISAETVFISRFLDNPKRYVGKCGGPMTVDDAWDGLSLGELRCYTARAKKNDIRNTAKLAKFNKRCPLSPSVEDSSSEWSPRSGLDVEAWRVIKSRRVALQRWKRYRYDHPRACGGSKSPVPKRPFRIMDLPFELRREIFSFVLRRSHRILQYPPDGSADVLDGPVDVRLFVVSRQVFAEALKVFYEVNIFTISTDPSYYRKAMPLFIRQSTGSEAPRPTNLIKRIHVHFRFIRGFSTNTDEFRFLWRHFCEFLKTCRNLRTVEISVRWPQYFSVDRRIDLQIDRLTEMLMNTGSTMGATFSDVRTYEPFLVDGIVWWPFNWRVRRIVGKMF